MSLTTTDLKRLYTALREHEGCVSEETLAQATGLDVSQVQSGLELLVKAGYAKNSVSCVEEIQFRTT